MPFSPPVSSCLSSGSRYSRRSRCRHGHDNGSGTRDQGAGVESSFPDGEIDCGTFPSQYGAIPVNHLNLGGWTGVQMPKVHNGNGYDDIMTMTHTICNGPNCCAEGAFCSYACPPGYQKSQWPETQGATGQSVGGIQCQGGKLHLTNSALSDKRCIQGASDVKVQVQNAKLRPNTRYRYRFYIDGKRSRSGRFKTLPEPGADVAGARFGYISCQDYTNGYYTALYHLEREKELDFIVHLGDHIYETVASDSIWTVMPRSLDTWTNPGESIGP